MSKTPRVPWLKPSEMDGRQKAFYDDVLHNMGRPDLPHVWQLPDGEINGPFTSMLHFPELGEPLYRLQLRVVKQDVIAHDVCELFILVVAAAEGCAYALYAHELLGRDAGVPEAVLTTVKSGATPDLSGNADYAAAYGLARALTVPGPVPAPVWGTALDAFGAEGVNVLVHTAAFFKYIGTLMNAYDEPVPGADAERG